MSVREQLKAFTGTAAGVRPVPCPECPVPGVFAAKLSAAAFVAFNDRMTELQNLPADAPAEAARKRVQRIGVQLETAAVDADGKRLFGSVAEALALDAEVAVPILELFTQLNGLSEKKSPPASSPPAA